MITEKTAGNVLTQSFGGEENCTRAGWLLGQDCRIAVRMEMEMSNVRRIIVEVRYVKMSLKMRCVAF